jgi:hypothetical protein
VKTVKEPKKPNILCHEIKPIPSKDRAMHEGDNPSFWDEHTAGRILRKFSGRLRRMLWFTVNWFDTDPIGADILHMPYWTQSTYKVMCQFKFWKGFVRTIFWGGRFLLPKVRNLENFTVSVSSKKSSIFLLIKIFQCYDTSSWGLELIQMSHYTNFVNVFFQIELQFFI